MHIVGFRPKGRDALLLSAALAVSSALIGCSNSDQTRKQLGALEKQISPMRADAVRMEPPERGRASADVRSLPVIRGTGKRAIEMFDLELPDGRRDETRSVATAHLEDRGTMARE